MSAIGIKLKLKKKQMNEDPYSMIVSDKCDWDLTPNLPGVKLFQADSELRNMQVDLTVKRISACKERVYGHGNLKDLTRNKQELTRLFREANSKILQNNASIYRFNEKYKDQTQARASLLEQILMTKQELVQYPPVKAEMEHYVQIYSQRYQTFLERVAQNSSEFNSIKGILNHFEMLEATQKECSQTLQTEMDEILHIKEEVTKEVEKKSNKLKSLLNSLTALGTREREAQHSRVCWSNKLKKIQNMVSRGSSELEALQLACNDMYKGMCTRRKQKPGLDSEDISGQMDYIRKSIVFYKEVLGIATILSQQRPVEVKKEETELQKDVWIPEEEYNNLSTKESTTTSASRRKHRYSIQAQTSTVLSNTGSTTTSASRRKDKYSIQAHPSTVLSVAESILTRVIQKSFTSLKNYP